MAPFLRGLSIASHGRTAALQQTLVAALKSLMKAGGSADETVHDLCVSSRGDSLHIPLRDPGRSQVAQPCLTKSRWEARSAPIGSPCGGGRPHQPPRWMALAPVAPAVPVQGAAPSSAPGTLRLYQPPRHTDKGPVVLPPTAYHQHGWE